MGTYNNHREGIARPSKEHIHAGKIAHMVGVAEYMRDRADDYGIDGNVAYTTGLLHDIGYLEGRVGHEEIGAEILGACGTHGDVVFAVANHAAILSDIPDEQVSPLLVLMVEADLSIDSKGFRVGFDKRLADIENTLADIERRYGADTKNDVSDTPIYQIQQNIEYIRNYQQEHGIPSQDVTLNHKMPDGYINHGSGKWVGSQTKAEIVAAYNKEKNGKDISFFDC